MIHGGTVGFHRLPWEVCRAEDNCLELKLVSEDGDQGFPGNADFYVTYSLEQNGTLRIRYDGLCDRDTVMNLTNHSYFNLAGHQNRESAFPQARYSARATSTMG